MKKQNSNIVFGFDFGTKRIGIAIGQKITKIARPLKTLRATNGIPQWGILDKLIKTWRPDALIVGIPLNMDGTEQLFTQSAKRFAELLQQRYTIPVYGIDERLTSVEARGILFNEGGYKALKDGKIDQKAAQIILENWLNQTEVEGNKE